MSVGPLQYIVIGFKDAKVSPELAKQLKGLKKLHDAGAINVVDAIVVNKDAEGNIIGARYSDISDEDRKALGVLAAGIVGYGAAGEEGAKAAGKAAASGKKLLTPEMKEQLLDAMPKKSTAVILVLEHHWAANFSDAVAESGGAILRTGFITVDNLLALGEMLGMAASEA